MGLREGSDEARETAIREFLTAVEHGEIDSAIGHLDAEIEWYPPAEGTLATVYSGHDGVRSMFALLFDSWAKIKHELTRVVHSGDRALVIADLLLEGRESHVVINEEWGYVTVFSGDRIRTVRMYTDVGAAAKAFEAA